MVIRHHLSLQSQRHEANHYGLADDSGSTSSQLDSSPDADISKSSQNTETSATDTTDTSSSKQTGADASPTPPAFRANNNSPKILGMDEYFVIDLGIGLAVLLVIALILLILYRRYKTRQDYNDTPENFAHKPNLAINEEYHLNHRKIQKCLMPQKIAIQEQNQVNGKLWKVQFKGTERSAVYFHRGQITTAYFEVEVLSVNGAIEIGFLPKVNFQKFQKGEENIGSSGVGVTNSGYVQAEGENIYNYSWILAYGDVFGIGLTKENSKFNERRAWISKNGLLLNYPPNDEMDRWLATVEISAEQKNQYNLGSDHKENDDNEQEKEDEVKSKQKMKRQKIEGLLKKQRISLKTFNNYEYYPVIVCHGNKDDTKTTVININVGGQVFRMFDSQFRSGLLKNTSLLGDD